MVRRPPLRWLTAALATLATGLALSQLAVSTAAFSDATDSGALAWSAASVAPVTSLAATGSCSGSTAPTVVGSTVAGLSTGVSLTVPSGTVSGDLLLVHIVNDNTSSAPPEFDLLLDSTGSIGNFQGRIYQRLATSTDAGTTYSFPVSGGRGSGALMVIRGAAGLVDAADAAGVADATKISTLTAPSLDAGVPGSLLVALYGMKQVGVTFTTPPGMTPGPAHPGSDGTSQAAFLETRTTAGATGARTSNGSSANEYTAQSVVVEPVATPAVTLSWTPTSSEFATGYTVLRDGAMIATLPSASSSTWTDSAAPGGTSTYEVRATAGSWTSEPELVAATSVC